MTGEVVTSTHNAQVVTAAKLHRRKARRATGLSLVEGPHLLEAAIAGGAGIERVFALEDDHRTLDLTARSGVRLTRVTREVLDRLAPTEHPRGPVAVLQVPDHQVGEGADLIVLWGIGDSGNAGTIIRSAAAFGFEVGVATSTVDLWSPKVLRAGAGAHFLTRVAARDIESVAALQSAGYTVLASVVSGGAALDPPPPGPVALLVGEEAHGLPDNLVQQADQAVTLRMPGGTESLNAAVAAGILMWELVRARRQG